MLPLPYVREETVEVKPWPLVVEVIIFHFSTEALSPRLKFILFCPADEGCTVRVTNLSENARDSDLQELFGRIGEISRIFLSKDKNTGQSRGFAFVSYKRREDAERAIKTLNGYGYDHLILTVEWSK